MAALQASSHSQDGAAPFCHRKLGPNLLCLLPTQSFVTIDLETTGFSHERDEIIEIAAIRLTPGQPRAPYYQRLVRTTQRLPSKIVRLTGIDDGMLEQEGADPCDAIRGLADFIGDDPVVSYNSQFDFRFLDAASLAHSVGITARSTSCALALSRHVWPGLPGYRLSDIARRLNLKIESEHRALDDARRAMNVYLHACAAHWGLTISRTGDSGGP